MALDVDFLQSLVGSASHLGLRLSSTTPNLYLSFAALEDELASPVATLQLEYISDSIPIMGDFNNDGVVDAADYTVWRNTLGSTTELAADANGNGMVDAEDYDLWKSHFGQPWGGGAPAAASLIAPTSTVPEPTSVLLSLMGLSLALLVRRTARVDR